MESISSTQLLIRERYQTLTVSERRIADYVLSNGDRVGGMRVHDLAVVTDVTNSAVIRFCKALGFSGFSEFKYNFASDRASTSDVYMLPTIKHGDGVTDIFNKIFTSNIRSLYETIQNLDMEQATCAVDLMKKARKILWMGTGSSEMTAMHAVFHLMQFGYSTFYATNGVTMRTAALNLQKGDLAIGISYCGHTRDTVDSLAMARQSGANTIAVTSYKDAPLCRNADVVLYAPPENIPYMSDGALTSTRNSITCILDSLIITLACQNYDNSLAKIEARNSKVFPTVRE